MNDNKGNYEIDAMHIIGLLLKRWWVIVLFVLAFSLAAFGYTSLFVTPTYRSSATLLINGDGSISSAYQQILAGQYQSKDYPHILQSNKTLSEAAKVLNEYDFPANGGKPYRTYNASVLRGMISCESVDDSRIFRINVTSTDPEEARIVANAVSEAFYYSVTDLTKSDIGFVDDPVASATPTSRGYGRNVVIGFAIGLVLGFAYAIIVGMVNDSIESEDWLLQSFHGDIPLLATVPDASTENKGYSRYRYGSKYGYSYYGGNKDKE